MADERRALSLLRHVPLLDKAPPDQLARLARRVEVFTARRRRVVYLPGDPGSHVFVLQAGRVKLSKVTRDGKELTLAIRAAGDLFGETCLIDGGARQEMAEVTDQATIGKVEREAFEQLVQGDAALGWRLVRLLAWRRLDLENRVEFLMFKDVHAKLAELLLSLVDQHGQQEARGTLITLKITHQEMANLIGSTRETVSLTLSEFRRKGLLRLEGRRVIVTNREGLRMFV